MRDMTSLKNAMANSYRTIRSYEEYAQQYSELVGSTPSSSTEAALRRMVNFTGLAANILEVGSGPGFDADFLESLGVAVRRTDATEAFIAIQAERGKSVAPLNIISDDLGGAYNGILALCVLIHMDREHTDHVLNKIKNALRLGGVFLVSILEGHGETAGAFHTVYWEYDEFIRRLALAGLVVSWHEKTTDSEGTWLTFLAERQS